MLPSKSWHSLRHRAEFLHLQKDAQKWITPAFILHASPSEPIAEPHVGFTVTKKIGNAVIRNRIRRRLRAVIEQIAQEGVLPPWKISFTARSDALTKDFTELVRDTKWALRKLALGKLEGKANEKPE